MIGTHCYTKETILTTSKEDTCFWELTRLAISLSPLSLKVKPIMEVQFMYQVRLDSKFTLLPSQTTILKSQEEQYIPKHPMIY